MQVQEHDHGSGNGGWLTDRYPVLDTTRMAASVSPAWRTERGCVLWSTNPALQYSPLQSSPYASPFSKSSAEIRQGEVSHATTLPYLTITFSARGMFAMNSNQWDLWKGWNPFQLPKSVETAWLTEARVEFTLLIWARPVTSESIPTKFLFGQKDRI